MSLAAGGEYFESRSFSEPTHPLRNEFQRDRDRVVHSKYFRRLEYKTQVFVNHLGDNFRTRLTHSIEVAQVSRTVARALNLNEDLTETVALAHDLGHPPFGHAGERALHEKMKAFGGFDHNEQTLRIVTVLEERYPNFMGLNLTRGTIDSLKKHAHVPTGQCLESGLVDICDEIAYNNHDIDDGLESGHLQLAQLDEVQLWRENYSVLAEKYPTVTEKILVRTTIRELVNQMVSDLIENSEAAIRASQIKNFEGILDYSANADNPPLIRYSNTMDARVKELKKFLFRNLYRHAEVVRMNERAQAIIGRIFDFIQSDPKMLPSDYHARVESMGNERVIADFIAGMTDRYALQWNSEILGN